jgi:PKHD-type hydroxylase
MYKVLPNLLTLEECEQLVASIKKTELWSDCPSVPGTRNYYNIPDLCILLGSLREMISGITEKRLKATYGYCRIYYKGCSLTEHTDRMSCEYSVTINIHQTHPWPIMFKDTPVMLNLGDGALYKGCEVPHSRPEFEGDEYIQVFLHYVDLDGPQKEYAFVPQIPTLLTYKFLKVCPYLTEHLEVPNAFSVEECDFIRDKNFYLEDGKVGQNEGTLSKVRKSKLFWIPKTHEWKDLYEKIMDIIRQANNEFYKFEISSISEDIQYTEYDAEYEGHYDWHLDIGPGCESSRKLSMTVQLSDESEYEGGTLEFKSGTDTKVITKKKGTAIIFPSYLLHRVNPVTKGKRRALVTWIEGPPFR